ncbi:MAG: hypothetical protein KIS73_27985 [Enhydrobacter sp.]|nr:hypothetical protein [Enhydrobacter sp.]
MSNCCQPRYVHMTAAGGTVPIDDDSGISPYFLPLLLPGVVANTLAHLKALTARPASVALAGRDAPGDGFGGVYFWKPDSTAEADDVHVIAPDLNDPPGRWVAFGQAPGVGGSLDDLINYEAPWTDAQQRTKAARLADALHLDDFLGSVATAYDGTDDTAAAWVAAIAAAEEHGRTLKVPRGGTYTVAEEITVPSGVRIELNPDATIVQATAGLGVFAVAGDDVVIEGNCATIEYGPVRSDPGGFYLGGVARDRISACFLTGHNPTVRNIRPKNFFCGVALRGPVVDQALSPTGYDHSVNGRRLYLDGIAADSCDFAVRGGQYQDGLIGRVSSVNETAISGDAGIVALIGLASGTAYAGVANRIDIRHIYSDGFTGARCITIGGGARNIGVDDVLLSNMSGTGIRVSGGASCQTGANTRVTGIKSGQIGVDYPSAVNCRQSGVYYEGAPGVPFIAVRASASATDIVVEKPEVVTDFAAATNVTSQNLFRAISGAVLTVRRPDIRHKQANDMFAFGADGATLRVLWPSNRGNVNGRVMRLDGTAIGLLRCYGAELDGFDERSVNSLTVNGTLTKDIVYPFERPKFGDYTVPSAAAGAGAALQAKLVRAKDIGAPVILAPGVHVLDSQSAPPGLSEARALVGFLNNEADGKHVALWGSDSASTILKPTFAEADQYAARFQGSPENPISVDLRRVTIGYDVDNPSSPLVFGSHRPLLSFRHAEFFVEEVDLRGKWDLTEGGGFVSNGRATGTVKILRVFDAAGTAINIAAGLGSATFSQEGNCPSNIRLLDAFVRNAVGHLFNGHGWRKGRVRIHATLDLQRLGWLRANAGVRLGNGGRDVEIEAYVFGPWRPWQLNDVTNAKVKGIFVYTGGPGIVGKKDTECVNVDLSEAEIIGPCQGVGHTRPSSVSEDPLEDITLETPGVAFLGGERHRTPKAIKDICAPVWNGRMVATAGSPIAKVIDSDLLGTNFVALSKSSPGDFVYRYVNTKKGTQQPPFAGRISTVDQLGHPVGSGGLLQRDFFAGPNGSGALIGTVLFGQEVPEGYAVEGGSCIEHILFDGPALYSMGSEADIGDPLKRAGELFRVRRLTERQVRTGVSEFAPSTEGTLEWRPENEPMLFRPGPVAGRISVSTAHNVVAATGASFVSLIQPPLQNGSEVSLFVPGANGRDVFVGNAQSVTNNNELVLTAPGLHDFTDKPYKFVLHTPMAYGGQIGDDQLSNAGLPQRLFDQWWDPNIPVFGFTINEWHVYPECLDPRCIPCREIRIRNTAITDQVTGHDLDAFVPTHDWNRTRLHTFEFRFLANIAGDITLRVMRVRDGVRRIVGNSLPVGQGRMQAGLNGVTAGQLVTITAPQPVAATISADDLLRPGDLILINAIANNGVGGTIAMGGGKGSMVGW